MIGTDAPKSLKDFSILIVEDNASSRQIIASLLKVLGFNNLTIAEDGAEALNMLNAENSTPDIILCDWQMPNVNGLEVAQFIRAQGKRCIFIMVTATDSLEAAMLAKVHGVDAYLCKPVTKANLEKVIEDAVSRATPLYEE